MLLVFLGALCFYCAQAAPTQAAVQASAQASTGAHMTVYLIDGGDNLSMVTKEISGIYSEHGPVLDVEGVLQHVHPVELCSEYGQEQQYGDIFILKLEAYNPMLTGSLCYSVTDQIVQAFDAGATAVVLIATDFTNLHDKLLDFQTERPLIVVHSEEDETKLFTILSARESAYMRITYTKPGSLSPLPVQTRSRPDALTYIILGGASGIIIITLIIALIISVKLGSAQRRQIEIRSAAAVLIDNIENHHTAQQGREESCHLQISKSSSSQEDETELYPPRLECSCRLKLWDSSQNVKPLLYKEQRLETLAEVV